MALVLHASMISAAAHGSSSRIDPEEARRVIRSSRISLASSLFPYLDLGDSEVQEENYDQYYDEIEEIEAQNRASQNGGGSS